MPASGKNLYENYFGRNQGRRQGNTSDTWERRSRKPYLIVAAVTENSREISSVRETGVKKTRFYGKQELEARENLKSCKSINFSLHLSNREDDPLVNMYIFMIR